MLPYKNRLISKKDFEKAHRFGNFFSFGVISLKVNKNEADRTRIGFSVGLKFSKKAVERNRVKRQLREIAHKNLQNLKKSFDLIVMVKKSESGQFSSQELEKDLISAFKKGNLICS